MNLRVSRKNENNNVNRMCDAKSVLHLIKGVGGYFSFLLSIP